MFSGSLSIPTLVQVSSPLKYLASSLKPFTCAVVRLSWTSIIRLRSAHLLASSSTVAPHLLFSLIYGFSLRRNNQIHNKEPFCRRVLTSLHWLETQCRHISCCSPTVRNRDSTHLHGLYVSIPELLDSPPQFPLHLLYIVALVFWFEPLPDEESSLRFIKIYIHLNRAHHQNFSFILSPLPYKETSIVRLREKPPPFALMSWRSSFSRWRSLPLSQANM